MSSKTASGNRVGFADDTTIEARVAAVAPIINEMCQAFVQGAIEDGNKQFQELLLAKIRAAELLRDDIWHQVDNVGVHPDNREGCGLVPIDVHDLLLRIVNDGWSYSEVDALAAEIPPNDEGQKWRAFNEQLAAMSNDLLAPIKGS